MSTNTTMVNANTNAVANISMLAHNQWACRPDDERFESTQALREHLMREKVLTGDSLVSMGALEFGRGVSEVTGRQFPVLRSKDRKRGDDGAVVSHWAFDQLCGMMKVPADYMRALGEKMGTSQDLMVQCLNDGLRGNTDKKRFLYRKRSERNERLLSPDHVLIRAVNGPNFGRIFDLDLVDRIIEIEKHGWKVPPARPVREGQRGTRVATEEDCLALRSHGLSIHPGDKIAPAGTYYGDRSSFYIRVNEEDGRSIEVNGQRLFRMLVVTNSEVGAGYWEVYLAWLMAICGNHILHGVQDLKKLKVRHVGASRVMARVDDGFTPDIVQYGRDTRLADEKLFEAARMKVLGPGKVEVVDGLFDKRIAPRKTLEAAWVKAEEHEGWYGRPNTAWGMAMGLTEVSQGMRWQDKRREVDEAAAKVMRMGTVGTLGVAGALGVN